MLIDFILNELILIYLLFLACSFFCFFFQSYEYSRSLQMCALLRGHAEVPPSTEASSASAFHPEQGTYGIVLPALGTKNGSHEIHCSADESKNLFCQFRNDAELFPALENSLLCISAPSAHYSPKSFSFGLDRFLAKERADRRRYYGCRVFEDAQLVKSVEVG